MYSRSYIPSEMLGIGATDPAMPRVGRAFFKNFSLVNAGTLNVSILSLRFKDSLVSAFETCMHGYTDTYVYVNADTLNVTLFSLRFEIFCVHSIHACMDTHMYI
jgi:hypothetical protein